MSRLAGIAELTFERIVLLSAALMLGGCFASNTPAISASAAEDVGQTLQYWSRSGSNPKADRLRFVRLDDREYQLQLVRPDQRTADPFANGIFIRRLGARNSDAIYLIQFDLEHFDLDPDINPEAFGFRYLSYPVSIDGEGVGTVGTVSCDDQSAIDRAAAVGIEVGCRDLVDVIVPDLGTVQKDGLVAELLFDLQNEGLVTWEDETGTGVLDWIE
jgi:hypothetical protein